MPIAPLENFLDSQMPSCKMVADNRFILGDLRHLKPLIITLLMPTTMTENHFPFESVSLKNGSWFTGSNISTPKTSKLLEQIQY
jgi:hypothetical protein